MAENLDDRLSSLQQLKASEEAGDKDPRYISDLELSITSVKNQIRYLQKNNAKGYEVVT